MNIEGLIGGYTARAARRSCRIRRLQNSICASCPNHDGEGALAELKAHLAKHGFGDIEVNMTGGYDPNTTPADAPMIKAEEAVYKDHGIDPVLLPRLGGSWPGYVFTNPPLSLGAGHFGLGHGSGAHAPDEYYVIESSNPKVRGWTPRSARTWNICTASRRTDEF